MALSTVSVSITDTWKIGHALHVVGTIAIGASSGTYPTGGFTLNLALDLIKAQAAPYYIHIIGQAAQSGQTQYDYTYVPGTNISNGVLKIFTGGAELSASTTPTGVTGDVIYFYALFQFGLS